MAIWPYGQDGWAKRELTRGFESACLGTRPLPADYVAAERPILVKLETHGPHLAKRVAGPEPNLGDLVIEGIDEDGRPCSPVRGNARAARGTLVERDIEGPS